MNHQHLKSAKRLSNFNISEIPKPEQIEYFAELLATADKNKTPVKLILRAISLTVLKKISQK